MKTKNCVTAAFFLRILLSLHSWRAYISKSEIYRKANSEVTERQVVAACYATDAYPKRQLIARTIQTQQKCQIINYSLNVCAPTSNFVLGCVSVIMLVI